MNVSVPIDVNDISLTSSTIPEVIKDFSEVAWSGATTYSLNDIIYEDLVLYISLRNNNLNNTPSTDVATDEDGVRGTWWKVYGYREYNNGTAYTAGQFVTLSNQHQVYQCIKDSTGNNPKTDIGANARGVGEYWQKAFPTNKYAMFDGLNNSLSSWFLSATVRVTPREVVNSVAVFNLTSSAEVTITQVDPTAGTTYSNTINTRDVSAVVDWYEYFNLEIQNVSEFIDDQLPTYTNSYIEVTFSVNQGENYQGIWAELTGSATGGDYSVSHNGSIWNLVEDVADITTSEPSITNEDWQIVGDSDVKVGSLLFGRVFTLGEALHGTSGESLDFSTKERDEFGNFVVVPRDTSKNIQFRANAETSRLNYVRTKTNELTTTPCVWYGVGTDFISDPTIVFGFNRDFRFTTAPNRSEFSLQVEGVLE